MMQAAELKMATRKARRTLDKTRQYRMKALENPQHADKYRTVADVLESEAEEWAEIALKLSKRQLRHDACLIQVAIPTTCTQASKKQAEKLIVRCTAGRKKSLKALSKRKMKWIVGFDGSTPSIDR